MENPERFESCRWTFLNTVAARLAVKIGVGVLVRVHGKFRLEGNYTNVAPTVQALFLECLRRIFAMKKALAFAMVLALALSTSVFAQEVTQPSLSDQPVAQSVTAPPAPVAQDSVIMNAAPIAGSSDCGCNAAPMMSVGMAPVSNCGTCNSCCTPRPRRIVLRRASNCCNNGCATVNTGCNTCATQNVGCSSCATANVGCSTCATANVGCSTCATASVASVGCSSCGTIGQVSYQEPISETAPQVQSAPIQSPATVMEAPMVQSAPMTSSCCGNTGVVAAPMTTSVGCNTCDTCSTGRRVIVRRAWRPVFRGRCCR